MRVSGSTRSSTTRPPRSSSTARSWPRPRRSGSAGASTASGRCRSPRGSCPSCPPRWCLAAAGLRPRRPRRGRLLLRPRAVPAGRPSSGSTTRGTTCASTTPAARPQFLAAALPGLDPEQVRFVPHHVAHAASAGARRAAAGDSAVLVLDGRGEGATHLAGAYRDGQLDALCRPGAAALARPALRGPHRAPRLPALQRRVQGDGAGLLRQAAVRRGRCASCRPRHRRRRLRRAEAPDWTASRRRAARTTEMTAAHADLAASCSAGSRRSCSSWPAGCTSRPASRAADAWPAGRR